MTEEDVIHRVQRMERYFDEVWRIVHSCPELLQKDNEVQSMIQALTIYCESGQWLQDYDCDARGELPKELKRGVLSQDALYDLLCEIDEQKLLSLQFNKF